MNINDGSFNLDKFTIFDSLAPMVLREIEKSCLLRSFLPSEKIIERKETRINVYFMISGDAHVLDFVDDGRSVRYAVLSEGSFFGEMAAINGLPRTSTVVAISPCRIAVMPPDIFMKLLTTYPEISLYLLRRMTSSIRAGYKKISNFSLLNAEQRICLELLSLVKPDPAAIGNWLIHPIPTQQVIASSVGVTRETVGRIFLRLIDTGIIDKKEKTLYVRDPDRLEEIALI